MKIKTVPLIFFGFLFCFSGCFTPSLRTASIPTKGSLITASIGFQFTYEKDPLMDAPTVDRILYIFSTLLNGLGVEFGTTLFGDADSGLDCSVGLVFGLGQQDIHPRCAVFQQKKGDLISLAVGYKLSLSIFLQQFDSERGESFFVGHGATVDMTAWVENTISPVLNLEVGQTLIPDKTRVEHKRRQNGKFYPPSVSTPIIYAWTLKSTAGLGLRFAGDQDLSQPNDFTLLLGFSPILRLDTLELKGFETAAVFQFEQE